MGLRRGWGSAVLDLGISPGERRQGREPAFDKPRSVDRRPRPDLAGADGASPTALQPPPHLLTTLPAPAGADGASAPSPTSLGCGGPPGRSASGDVVSGARHRAGRDGCPRWPPSGLVGGSSDRPPTNPPSCRGLRGSTTRRRARRPPPRLAYVAERQGWARCPRGPSFRAQGSPASGAAPGPRRRGPMAGGARTAMKPPPATSPALS